MIGVGTYTFDEQLEPAIVRAKLDTIRRFMETGVNIIADETYMDKETRRGVIDLGEEFHYEIMGIVMPPLTKKESVDRRMQNPHGTPNRSVWEDVWDKFENKYECPKTDEGFNWITFLS